ncbi:exodeoxyribonuclease V subunit alpha [Chitinibacter sp. GC72]|uniref:exodeoxyribonuclease V subunit alpha n=1 Tax=Chitinibacter sp. GC72 TaxID=1526917 RepID=UPI0012F87277|nr:exodeoxyribonuclease V subunit alpha [Chitinibacter sp. GC72]
MKNIAPSVSVDFASALCDLLLRQNPDAPADLLGLASELAKASERGDVCVSVPPQADTAAWLKTGLVGEPGSFTPLIVEHQRLYLARYHAYESRLAAQLLRIACDAPSAPDEAELRIQLDRFFGSDSKETDWQKVAVAAALHQRLTLISGGPGTGKTTTLIKLLSLLQIINAEQPLKIGLAAQPLKIVLAAPTGKAAMRMQEAIAKGKKALGEQGLLAPEMAAQIPDTASTLHRLLGSRLNSVQFRHHAAQPLVLDVLVLDEASMIDLALMSKLVDALPPHARLILLGDKDQLASVEAGAVMGDLCAGAGLSPEFAAKLSRLTGQHLEAGFTESRLGEHVQTLHKSYRFSGPIADFARAINHGDIRKISELLAKAQSATHGAAQGGKDYPIRWQAGNPAQQDITPLMMASYAPYFAALDDYIAAMKQGGAGNELALAVFSAFDAFRVLSPIRHGAASVSRVNALIEAQLLKQGRRMNDQLWYAGRPVLVPQNLYDLELYNGDIGLTLPDENGKLWVHFPSSNGAAAESAGWATRRISPSRLPAVETAFAMTVHKSQGSEFAHVLLLLPSPQEGRSHLSRELVYTAITRAKTCVSIWGEEAQITAASRRGVERQSGLAERLLVRSV